MVPESQLNDMRDRVNALKGENESLKRDLVRATNTDKATKKNTLSIKYTERGRLSNGI